MDELLADMEKLEYISRKLVSTQVNIEEMKNDLEKKYKYRSVNPVNSEMFFEPGPPQKLKIVVPLFPPKIQINANLAHKMYKPYVSEESLNLWNATMKKLHADNEDKYDELPSFNRTIIWITYFFTDKRNYNVNNLSLKVIISALSNYFLPSAHDNRSYTLILNGDTDKARPRTEIVIIEDLGQLGKLKQDNDVFTRQPKGKNLFSCLRKLVCKK